MTPPPTTPTPKRERLNMGELSEQNRAHDLEARIFDWLGRKYVQRSDERQRAMGLQYTTAETHDLAKGLAALLDAARTEGRGEGQPVAWAYEYTNHLKGDRAPGGWLRAVAFEAPTRARVNAGFARNVQPLYASPIREPEISREAVIEAIRQHVRTRYERREHHGAYHFSGLEAAADAILNLAQHQGGGRG